MIKNTASILMCIVCLVAFSGSGFAKNKPASKAPTSLELPLQAAWQYAVSHSTEALQARYERRQAERQASQAAWDLLPTLTLQGGYVLEDDDGDSRWTGNVQIQSPPGGLGQQIFRFSIRKTLKSLGEAKADAMYDNLYYNITKNYVTYFYLDELRSVYDSADAELKELSSRVNIETQKGVLDAFESMQLRKKLLDAKHKINSLELKQHETLLRIKKLLGVPGENRFRPLGSMASIAACVNTPGIYRLDKKKNLDLEVMRTRLELQSAQTVFSRLQQLPMPDYSLRVGFGQEARPYWTVREDLNDVHYHLFMGLKWDLITWGKVGRDIEDNRDKEQLLKRKIENTVRGLVNFCNFAKKKSTDLKSRKDALENLLLEYAKVVKASRKQYLMGRISAQKWLQIRLSLLSNQAETLDLSHQELLLNIESVHLLTGLRKYLDKCYKP